MKKIFRSNDPQLRIRNGKTVEVLRPLTEEEADLHDVGPMFLVKFENGATMEVYGDELADE